MIWQNQNMGGPGRDDISNTCVSSSDSSNSSDKKKFKGPSKLIGKLTGVELDGEEVCFALTAEQQIDPFTKKLAGCGFYYIVKPIGHLSDEKQDLVEDLVCQIAVMVMEGQPQKSIAPLYSKIIKTCEREV